MPTVNLVLRDNGVGLTRDMRILCDAWSRADYEVFISAQRRGTLRKWLQPLRLEMRLCRQKLRGDDALGRFDFNVMLEHIRPEYLALAKCNVLIPNPEWFSADDAALLRDVDLVLAKTHHAQSIFEALGCTTHYLGFTSPNRFDPQVPRRAEFFHLAGRSVHKGTESLLDLWERHPEWPRLTIVQHPKTAQHRRAAANIDHRIGYLRDAQLRKLENCHLFHLCPSQTEGFGHYIVSALSLGAVTLTVDAPPMNELVTPQRGMLVPYLNTGTHGLATTFHFDAEAMQECILAAMEMAAPQINSIRSRARTWYVTNDEAFRRRAVDALRVL